MTPPSSNAPHLKLFLALQAHAKPSVTVPCTLPVFKISVICTRELSLDFALPSHTGSPTLPATVPAEASNSCHTGFVANKSSASAKLPYCKEEPNSIPVTILLNLGAKGIFIDC